MSSCANKVSYQKMLHCLRRESYRNTQQAEEEMGVLQLDVLMLSVKARARLTWVEGMVRGDACMGIA